MRTAGQLRVRIPPARPRPISAFSAFLTITHTNTNINIRSVHTAPPRPQLPIVARWRDKRDGYLGFCKLVRYAPRVMAGLRSVLKWRSTSPHTSHTMKVFTQPKAERAIPGNTAKPIIGTFVEAVDIGTRTL
ncbi:hypothetical protein SCOCK_280044 [Actinacidiphila cocklensis]|uniref:Uncharacterized protein n=1 Tax=Actinacidiphila cocklensis TaxID=887465 RepID=A0A9W4GRS2_9ACTN|nr:hypothetical protein SCOCK_280044 [Actinacidiphila cocklensis]